MTKLFFDLQFVGKILRKTTTTKKNKTEKPFSLQGLASGFSK